MIDPNTVILIAGPTASGKTRLAISLAQNIDGVIVNADSMQVYQELSILTARPTKSETEQAPHELFGTVSITQHYSVARWRNEALSIIKATHNKGQIPILTGGTGLYFKALIDGLSPIPDVSLETREEISTLYDKIGATSFHEKLQAIDPQTAQRLPATDRQRCIRAMEVYEETGKTLTYWQNIPRIKAPDHLTFTAFILKPKRQTLYERIDKRFDDMIAQGALDEVRAIHQLNLPPFLPSLKAVGIPPLRDYLNGNMSLEEAVELAKTQSRRYAKRQFTWFNNQMPEQTSEKLSIIHLAPPISLNSLTKHLL